jgi:2-keto-3-deoxy-L-rhamnonate aldolase RhmA
MKALKSLPFDFVWIDLEHGSLTLETAGKAIDSLTATPILPLIRAKSTQVDELSKIMDLGAAIAGKHSPDILGDHLRDGSTN